MGTLNSRKSTDLSASSFEHPFSAIHQLNNELDNDKVDPVSSLPGHPRISLVNKEKLLGFLEKEFCSKDLDRLAPRLWWMSKQDSKNISPLHRQKVKKRNVVITENPKLHLVWIHDRIFIKPLPEYLLSYVFWKKYLLSDCSAGGRSDTIRRAALGYLRTYFYLIQHESDFQIAQDQRVCLVPARITWNQFCNFSVEFEKIQDHETSERYRYGEIRLTRLNFYAKILLHRWYFQRMDSQYGTYFAQFYGPILFIFGILSVILNAMQVEITVEQVGLNSPLTAFRNMIRGFSIASMIGLVCLSITLFCLLVYKIAKEWHYALCDRYGRRKQLRGHP